MVSAVTGFGVFVTLDSLYVEGLVHITELGGEYFRFDEARQELRGERTGILSNGSPQMLVSAVEAAGLIVRLGSICWIELEHGQLISAEVVGFKDGRITLVPFGHLSGGSIGLELGFRLPEELRALEAECRVPDDGGVAVVRRRALALGLAAAVGVAVRPGKDANGRSAGLDSAASAPIDRCWPRSLPRVCFSNSSRQIRRAFFRRSPTHTSMMMWSTSIWHDPWTRSVPNSLDTPSRLDSPFRGH